MRYAKSSMLRLAVTATVVLCYVEAAKLDKLQTSQLSRGGFRAGFHDTGIWGANLHNQQNSGPPKWGPNGFVSPNSFQAPNSYNSQNTFSSSNNFIQPSNTFASSAGRPLSLSSSFSLPTPDTFTSSGSFGNFGGSKSHFNTFTHGQTKSSPSSTGIVTSSSNRQTGAKLSQLTSGRGKGAQNKFGGSNTNRFVSQSSSAPRRGYFPPPAVQAKPTQQQGYNYNPPQVPFNLYQPPTTTTTPAPPPPPPSGLYNTPVVFRPIPQRPFTTRRPPTTRRPTTRRPTTRRPTTRRPTTRRPTTTTRRPAPPPQAPTSLYQTPQAPTGLYQIPQASRPVPQVRPPRPSADAAKQGMFGMPYDFAYGVNDEDSGNHYSRQESHDGHIMRGQYKVLLPDGRLQVVTYFDDGNGFNAEVTYE